MVESRQLVAHELTVDLATDASLIKNNRPRSRVDIALVFTIPPAGDRQESTHAVDVGLGRIEQRNITTSEALVGDSDWLGLAQVFELGRHVITQKMARNG